ncbi:MAG: polysaccharide deacetylase family protein [Helicobacteraceae bacterium]|jgi:peptidoglycan/xylan/chitin deacetylase (PgdA/CDA1 family)|nr:polysaccharide deacetylase family protein [Helicobacteraceae bacterium]
MNGYFVISLDFELMWGVRENRSIASYGDAILGVHNAMPKMLDIFDKYGIKATVAAVGFLFLSNKEELLARAPSILPDYADQKVSPYGAYIDNLKNGKEDRYHFAPQIIDDIKKRDHHEIATHTLSHYNALARGQTIDSFRADLTAAIKIANEKEIPISSIVFPRNQCNLDYLQVCKELGIICYRGRDRYAKNKILRDINRYIPLFNDRPYPVEDIFGGEIINIWGSEHWKANIKSRGLFNSVSANMRLERVKKTMLCAAKNNLIYHIWYHPHEFGRFTDEKLKILDRLCARYKRLNETYGFESATMSGLAKKTGA